jgi:hypothetical protein
LSQWLADELPAPDRKKVPSGLVNSERDDHLTSIGDRSEGRDMAKIHYRIVEHDGGWAYKLDDVFSEPFRTKATALAAARRVAAEQHIPGDTTNIEFQDEAGKWHTERSEGDDRPDADVVP